MKSYRGFRTCAGEALVSVDEGETQHLLDLRLDLRNHSPDGFEWGYAGSGPAQLSLALLADVVGDERALKYYQQFKSHVIQNLERASPWRMDEDDIRQVIQTLERVGIH